MDSNFGVLKEHLDPLGTLQSKPINGPVEPLRSILLFENPHRIRRQFFLFLPTFCHCRSLLFALAELVQEFVLEKLILELEKRVLFLSLAGNVEEDLNCHLGVIVLGVVQKLLDKVIIILMEMEEEENLEEVVRVRDALLSLLKQVELHQVLVVFLDFALQLLNLEVFGLDLPFAQSHFLVLALVVRSLPVILGLVSLHAPLVLLPQYLLHLLETVYLPLQQLHGGLVLMELMIVGGPFHHLELIFPLADFGLQLREVQMQVLQQVKGIFSLGQLLTRQSLVETNDVPLLLLDAPHQVLLFSSSRKVLQIHIAFVFVQILNQVRNLVRFGLQEEHVQLFVRDEFSLLVSIQAFHPLVSTTTLWFGSQNVHNNLD